MEKLIGVLQTLLPVLLTLGIGLLCRKTQKFDRSAINAMKNAAVDICLPAVLLNAFATASYSLKSVIIPLLMFGICVLALVLGRLLQRFAKLSSRFVPYLTTGFEAGMLGYALFRMLCGEAATPSFALIDLGQVLFVFTLYKLLLQKECSGHADTKKLLREMMTSPVMLSIIVGVLLGATGLYAALIPSGIAGVIDSCTSLLSNATSVLILLAIGYDLVFTDIRWGETLRVISLRLVIMIPLMLLMILLNRLLFGWDRLRRLPSG